MRISSWISWKSSTICLKVTRIGEQIHCLCNSAIIQVCCHHLIFYVLCLQKSKLGTMEVIHVLATACSYIYRPPHKKKPTLHYSTKVQRSFFSTFTSLIVCADAELSLLISVKPVKARAAYLHGFLAEKPDPFCVY